MSSLESINLDFAYAFGKPKGSARFRCEAADFIVEEELGFAPGGEGEHVLLYLTKTGQNTHWVAQQIARFAGVKNNDVGYCGRKDRHAQCTQWFSVYLPGNPSIDWDGLNIPGVSLHSCSRHSHKLRPGQHSSNRFLITLRDVKNIDEALDRLERVSTGVPNYFGEQRFGHSANNLKEAAQWAGRENSISDKRKSDKKQRGLWISALRSYVFNTVLSQRVSAGNWCQVLPGDMETVVPTGPLWGRGRPLVAEDTNRVELEALAQLKDCLQTLEHCGLFQERRYLVCEPKKFSYRFEDGDLQLGFTLAAGQFATSVLREVAVLENHSPTGLVV